MENIIALSTHENALCWMICFPGLFRTGTCYRHGDPSFYVTRSIGKPAKSVPISKGWLAYSS